MKTNQDYKNAALAALKGNWASAVLAAVLFMIIMLICVSPSEYLSFKYSGSAAALSPEEALAMLKKVLGLVPLTTLVGIFLIYPLELGYYNAHRYLLTRGEDDLAGNMFRIAFKGYGHKVWGMFLMGLYILLWTFLFIIPGIIKAFSYAMTPFILEEHPELSANEAIDRSRAMMKGRKFDLFYLCLSFIGWILICILTLGIGLLWLMPYMTTSIASFYEDAKEDYEKIAIEG